MTVAVRAARSDDFTAVTCLLELLGRARVTAATERACRAVFEAQVAEEGSGPLVAEDDDGAVIACCSLHFRPRLNRPVPDAWIPDLVVAPGARRRGAARAMLGEAGRLARARGCWQLTLESDYPREEAHVLYEAFGMTNQGYYFALSFE